MIESLPFWMNALFITSFILTLVFFYYSNGKPKRLIAIIIFLAIVHSILSLIGFYEDTTARPPRFILVLLPSTLLIIYGLLPKQRVWFLENRNTTLSSLLHIIRIPVEIVLFGLYTEKMIPKLMTFEGRNYDILMGITAPLIAWLVYKNKLGKTGQLLWNGLGLILIFTIVILALLSAELPFQKFAFDQPNIGVNYFPFILLPAVIVPIVIYTHISDIIKIRWEI